MMKVADYQIKSANGNDRYIALVLRDMHEKIFGDTAPQIVPKEGYWWLAWADGEPVAFAGLRLSPTTPGTAYLNRSGVLPKHRGKGLQVRLIRAREAKARALEQDRIVTDTASNNPSANSLIRAGYRLFTPIGPWALDESLYWERKL